MHVAALDACYGALIHWLTLCDQEARSWDQAQLLAASQQLAAAVDGARMYVHHYQQAALVQQAAAAAQWQAMQQGAELPEALLHQDIREEEADGLYEVSSGLSCGAQPEVGRSASLCIRLCPTVQMGVQMFASCYGVVRRARWGSLMAWG